MSAASSLDFVLTPLTPADHAARARGELGSAARASPLRAIRQVHHYAARLLAGGASDTEAAALLGWAPARVRALRGDPAFQELIALYIERRDEIALDLRNRMELLAADGLALLHERLLDPRASGAISEAGLLEIVKAVLDRVGHSVTQRSVATHLVVGADVERLRAAAAPERVAVVEDVREALAPPAREPEAPE